MRRTTIVLPDELRQRIKRIAAERGQSMAQFIREAAEEKAYQASQPLPKSIGMGASGHTDLAERASDLYEPDPWR